MALSWKMWKLLEFTRIVMSLCPDAMGAVGTVSRLKLRFSVPLFTYGTSPSLLSGRVSRYKLLENFRFYYPGVLCGWIINCFR